MSIVLTHTNSNNGVKSKPGTFIPHTRTRFLQCKCVCGGASGVSGECEECRKKRLRLQRQVANHHKAISVPPIVREVLRSPGQPLDPPTRAFMESRFGHDFSKVRVHTDTQAAESTQAVSALAYTVGHDVVFGASQYAPTISSGRRLLAHELTHVVQQTNQSSLQNKLEIGVADDQYEREADEMATNILNKQSFISNLYDSSQVQQSPPGLMQRKAIYRGRILDEGSCEHLACNSKWACEDNKNGITCPKGTRNASTTKKYRPLFTCDTKCENNETCSDNDNWMAIPKKRFARSKCNQDLVICANGKFTHAHVRDRSHVQAWEVGHGVQDALNVSPYATFTGSIYGDENDSDFKQDSHCHSKASSEKSATSTIEEDEAGTAKGSV